MPSSQTEFFFCIVGQASRSRRLIFHIIQSDSNSRTTTQVEVMYRYALLLVEATETDGGVNRYL